MSSLKKDIEELVDEHADAVLEARDEANTGRAVELQDKADLDFTLKIINLIEEAERDILERIHCCDNEPTSTENPIDVCRGDHFTLLENLKGKDIKSKLIGGE